MKHRRCDAVERRSARTEEEASRGPTIHEAPRATGDTLRQDQVAVDAHPPFEDARARPPSRAPTRTDRRGEQAPDAELAERVEASLRASPDVPERAIEVSSVGTTVTLSGEVETLLAKQEALAVARSTPGVSAIVDRVDLEPHRRPDDVVERRVAQALMVDPGTDYTIDVEVFRGIARLRGVVDAPSDVVAVRRTVSSVPGVTGIIDELSVRRLATAR